MNPWPLERILAHHRAHSLRQPVKPAAHVRRLERQPEARPRPARPVFVQRPQARQPPHAALSSTAASARTMRGVESWPHPQTPPIPQYHFHPPIPGRRRVAAGRARTSALDAGPLARSARPGSVSLPRISRGAAVRPAARSRFFHQKKCDAHNSRSRQNAATLCPLRACSETNLCHFRRACLLRSRCVIAPASPPAGHDATLPHTPARCASHIAHQ